MSLVVARISFLKGIFGIDGNASRPSIEPWGAPSTKNIGFKWSIDMIGVLGHHSFVSVSVGQAHTDITLELGLEQVFYRAPHSIISP